MKNFTLLVASVLLIGNLANANETKIISKVKAVNYYENEPLSFTERGIEFFVFPNGDFDFNTRPDDSQGNYQFKTAGRRSTEVNRGNRPINYGVLIEQDSFGRVRRVGNTFINYDFSDRVTRIGTVYMQYNRFALDQIGNMRLIYNRHGQIVNTVGNIKGNRYQGYAYQNNQNNSPYYQNNNSSDYYYKKNDKDEKDRKRD
ncbi:MAG: hypothetical protein ACJAQ1_001661 [Flavobacterium sp.]|jgi:hypothetical protein